LTIWVDPQVSWKAEPTGKWRRQPRYNDAAIRQLNGTFAERGLTTRGIPRTVTAG